VPARRELAASKESEQEKKSRLIFQHDDFTTGTPSAVGCAISCAVTLQKAAGFLRKNRRKEGDVQKTPAALLAVWLTLQRRPYSQRLSQKERIFIANQQLHCTPAALPHQNILAATRLGSLLALRN